LYTGDDIEDANLTYSAHTFDCDDVFTVTAVKFWAGGWWACLLGPDGRIYHKAANVMIRIDLGAKSDDS
jgi:hypothetical protein